MREVEFAFGHLQWLSPPVSQMGDLLLALDRREDIMRHFEANRTFCGTILDDDGLPILCSGIYEKEDHGVAWTFFHDDMAKYMVGCVRIVRKYMQKFITLTGKPVCATVDENDRDAMRWAAAVGLTRKKEGIWWVRPR